MTISRLGFARPDSRKLKWRCETCVSEASSSCEYLRAVQPGLQKVAEGPHLGVPVACRARGHAASRLDCRLRNVASQDDYL